MKILVPVKRVVDPNVRIRVKSDGSGIELNQLKMTLNPFDEIAIEEAIRIKEALPATEVVAVTCGVTQCQETLRTCLAMGADRAVLLETSADLEPLTIAKLLKSLVDKDSYDLILMGKQSTDGENNQTGQMLSALTGFSQVTYASKVEVKEKFLHVTRETDSGTECLQATLPAIVTVDLRLNEPRYVTLPNIMKAKKKPIDVIEADSLGVELKSNLKILKTTEPSSRKAGIKVQDIKALADQLKQYS